MAKLPSQQDLGITDVNPSRAVASYDATTGMEGQASRNILTAAGEFGQAGDYLFKAKQEFDRITAEDKANQYQERMLKYQSEWMQKKGRDAVAPDYIKTTTDEFGRMRDDLASSLEDANARRLFTQRANAISLHHQASLYSHVASERDKYDIETHKASQELAMRGIAANSYSDEAFNATVKNIQDREEQFYGARGASPEQLAALSLDVRQQAIIHRIKAALNSGDPYAADRMYNGYTDDKGKRHDGYKEELSPKYREHIEPQIRQELIPAQEISTAKDVVKTIDAETTASVKYDSQGVPSKRDRQGMYGEVLMRLSTAAAKQFPTDPRAQQRVIEIGISEWAKTIQVQSGAEAADMGAVYNRVDSVLSAGKSISVADILSDPESKAAYNRLDGKSRLQINDYIRGLQTRQKDDPEVYNDVVQKIISRQYTDERQLYPHFGRGIDPTHRGTLLQLMEDVKTGGHLSGKQVQEATAAFKTDVSKDPMMMFDGAAQGRAVYEWHWDVMKKIKERMKSGESLDSLFDPRSKDYILDPQYTSTFKNAGRNQAVSSVKDFEDAKKAGKVIKLPAFKNQEEAAAFYQKIPPDVNWGIMPDGRPARIKRPQQPAQIQSGSGSLGVRNNNPGNIEKTTTAWSGEVESPGRFKTFATPEDGIKAMVTNLQSYGAKGFDTVSTIINRWAPPTDKNPTSNYIKTVAKGMGVSPDKKLDLSNPETVSSLVREIIKFENSGHEYSPEMLKTAVASALGVSTTAGTQAAPAKEAPAELTIDDIKVWKPMSVAEFQAGVGKKMKERRDYERQRIAIEGRIGFMEGLRRLDPIQETIRRGRSAGSEIAGYIPVERDAIYQAWENIKETRAVSQSDIALIRKALEYGLSPKDEVLARKILKKLGEE